MPYYEDNPLAAALGAAGSFLSGSSAAKQQTLENKRQAELDRQNAALIAAQMGNEAQQTRALYGYDPNLPQLPKPTYKSVIPTPPPPPGAPPNQKFQTQTAGGRTTATYEGAGVKP